VLERRDVVGLAMLWLWLIGGPLLVKVLSEALDLLNLLWSCPVTAPAVSIVKLEGRVLRVDVRLVELVLVDCGLGWLLLSESDCRLL